MENFFISMVSFGCLLAIAFSTKEMVKQNKKIIELLEKLTERSSND
jgi:hypothetical protein